MDLLCFCSVLCLLCLCARLFICALWSPAGKGLTSWLSFVVSTVSLSLHINILGQVWYLIVWIPDLCTRTYFGLIFGCNEGVIETVNEYLGDQENAFLFEGIRKLKQRWAKCIALKRDYIEK